MLEKFYVYLMDKNGRYLEPKMYTNIDRLMTYIKNMRNSYYEIRVTDINDFIVMHLIDGKIIFPNNYILE